MDYVFERLIQGIGHQFTVGYIMPSTPLCCTSTQKLDEAFRGHDGIDQLFVEQDGGWVGLIERNPFEENQLVADRLIPLNALASVQIDTQLLDCLDKLEPHAGPAYRIVLEGDTPLGLVQISDFNKLPMKVLAFAYIAQLEKQLQREIAQRPELCREYQIQEIIETDDPEEWARLRSYFGKLVRNDNYITLLDATTFHHKIIILRNADGFGASFVKDLTEIRELRNWVSHTNPMDSEPQTFAQLQSRMRLVKKWIERLRQDDKGAR